MTTICHYWPGITPFNIRNLIYSDFCIFVANCESMDHENRSAQKPAPDGGFVARR